MFTHIPTATSLKNLLKKAGTKLQNFSSLALSYITKFSGVVYRRILRPILLLQDRYFEYFFNPIINWVGKQILKQFARLGMLQNRTRRGFALFMLGGGLHTIQQLLLKYLLLLLVTIIAQLIGVPTAVIIGTTYWANFAMYIDLIHFYATIIKNAIFWGRKMEVMAERISASAERQDLLDQVDMSIDIKLNKGVLQFLEDSIVILNSQIREKIIPYISAVYKRWFTPQYYVETLADRLRMTRLLLDAEEVMETRTDVVTPLLDQAIQQRNFNMVHSLLRDVVTADFLEGLRLCAALLRNKYTADDFWQVPESDIGFLERKHPELCCSTFNSLMRIPVYLIKNANSRADAEARTYLDLFSLLKNFSYGYTRNPETREPINSLQDVKYDPDMQADITQKLQELRKTRLEIELGLAANDAVRVLSALVTSQQIPGNMLEFGELQDYLHQQSSMPNETNRQWRCNISLKRMEIPVYLEDANSQRHYYDLKNLLAWFATSNKAPFDSQRTIASFADLTVDLALKQQIDSARGSQRGSRSVAFVRPAGFFRSRERSSPDTTRQSNVRPARAYLAITLRFRNFMPKVSFALMRTNTGTAAPQERPAAP